MIRLTHGLGLAALVSAALLLSAALVAAAAARGGRARQRTVALALGLIGAGPLLLLAGRPAASPFIAFVVVVVLAGPQPLAFALAAGAAVLACLAPATGAGPIALVLAGAAAAVATHALGRSASAHATSGQAGPALLAGRVRDPEEEQAAPVLSRLVVVLALLATLAAGIEGWLRAGTCVTMLGQRLLAAALVGFAASETPRWRGAARTLTLGALLVAVLAPES